MDFEKLFPLIIIMIFWGVSNALRRISKASQKDQTAADQKPGLLKVLLQNLAAMEEANQGEEVQNLNEYLQPPSQPLVHEHEKESLIERAEESLQQEAAIRGRETISTSPPAGATKPQPIIIRKKPRMTNRRKLQNAVVWAEILAPPIALRDQ